MGKRHNKKHSKNEQTNPKHNNEAYEDEVAPQDILSAKERAELKYLVSLLVKVGVFEKCVNPKDAWRQYENVQKILQVITKVEAPLNRKRTEDAGKNKRLANIDKFYDWATEFGLYSRSVEIKEFPDYDLGLAATGDIKEGDLIFSVGRNLILSEENLQNEYFKTYSAYSNMRLAFTLMIEAMKPNSFWKPYIDLLPDSYNSVLYYTVEDMAELKGSNALPDALKLCQTISSLYANLCIYPEKNVPQFKEMFSYDLLRWAVSTVMTRENLIPRSVPAEDESAPKVISALIPFWDMSNHRDGTITSFFNIETEAMESTAQADFKKGEQVFMHYGNRCNADLMVHNGFINPSNPKDRVAIKLGLNTSDPLFEKRNELLQLLNIPKHTQLDILLPPEHISAELLGFVRVFNMTEEQLEHWIKSERAMDLLHIDCALETALEAKTWQYLQIRLTLLLKAFPTTLEDDEKLFEGLKKGEIKPKRNYIQMMVLEYRILEKRILAAALDYVKQRAKA